ncbi:MAG TPA: hypothetical protein VK680_04070 [Solirubrobacteraceae bacterium]|nr:hypothetical protein [Solirubrobacteraceae bacterium]
MEDVMEDLDGMLLLAREGTIIRHVSVFESYLHCWSLNFLLAKLESEIMWTAAERKVAQHLSPVHLPGSPMGVVATLKAFDDAYSLLETLPPFFKHPVTRVGITGRDEVGLSAREALEFWIALRNLLVHRDGWVSAHFLARQGPVWDKLFASRGYIANLRSGKPLPLLHDMVSSVGLTVYRSCKALNELLVTASNGRRGIVLSGAEDPAVMAATTRRRQDFMLMEGDHYPSLRWTNDASFREQLVPGLAET